jgi:hypothetical protein
MAHRLLLFGRRSTFSRITIPNDSIVASFLMLLGRFERFGELCRPFSTRFVQSTSHMKSSTSFFYCSDV